MTAPRDPGLQPERTALAWRRTLLAVAVGSLVSMRVLQPALGDLGIVLGLGGLATVGALWVLVDRRHRVVEAVFRGLLPTSAMPSGALLLALTVLAASAAAAGLLLALLLHPGFLAR